MRTVSDGAPVGTFRRLQIFRDLHPFIYFETPACGRVWNAQLQF